ncbi:MAG: leucyl aminopeptidase, leucyl aminopeptidase [Candidatus Peregrinibacteria bacterium GW2011_GWE2_39_6]|nr:MAG: leucyl aminopeptidase, leucyl aminopeptidase [Candidatus Peregrinibacteria bacterium GW2011_GWF2_39_17]KKR25797.1 MAG: leucyl aminopeptidase, leucyl aminopeptidase [Candidatus Peregrinibacteria bacterium GW2011_GWE2_39_6]HCW32749.1 leucyl aminopeptidase [Candidatus Peregrinibacteria bacterium]
MNISLPAKLSKCDLLILPLYASNTPPLLLKDHSRADFEGKTNETVLLYQKDKLTPRILLVGLGQEKKTTTEIWRQAGGTVANQLKKGLSKLAIIPPKESLRLILAFIEGFYLGHYKYEPFLNDPERQQTPLSELQIIIQDKTLKKELEIKLKELQIITKTVNSVRDQVNSPSNILNPTQFAKNSQKVTKKSRKINCKIFDEKSLQKINMNCLVSVGKGARDKAKLIILEYKSKPINKRPLVLVGKGICFDAGGINLKTRDLEYMKYDMTGAATVLGIFEILAELNLPLHIIGVLPCAENMLGENAFKPGDILTAYDKTTVEILNTDAEGRLILADALAYAVKNFKPEIIIDVATLTGAAITALGYDIAALIGNNQNLTTQLKQAATQVDEKIWELPLDPDYKKEIKSDIADIKNYSAEVGAGVIMGGAFLEHFVKDTPWAHLDMGGSAWTNKAKSYYPKGATGRMVRTLWQFLKNYKPTFD